MTMTAWWIILGVLFFGIAGIYIVIFFASPFVVIGKWIRNKRARRRAEAKKPTERIAA